MGAGGPRVRLALGAGREEASMSRITAINLLLLIAAVVLALALFIAGAMWRGRVMKEGPHSHWRPRIMQIS
jgi:hypothetical protein